MREIETSFIIVVMESLKELYRIGYGPSSSHTMGPRKASEDFIANHPEIKKVRAELYGSLAATGKGHLTDKAIRDAFKEAGCEAEIFWYPDVFKKFHPNCLSLSNEDGTVTETYYSVGGGKIVKEGEESKVDSQVYPDEELGNMDCAHVKPIHHTKETKCLNTCLLAAKALEKTILETVGE